MLLTWCEAIGYMSVCRVAVPDGFGLIGESCAKG